MNNDIINDINDNHSESQVTPEFISIADAAILLGMHKNTIRQYIARGLLQAYKAPHATADTSKLFLKREDIMKFLVPVNKHKKEIVYD